MGIRISEDGRAFYLETRTSSYVMKADELGTLLHLYYGEKTGEDDLSLLLCPVGRGHSANPHEIGMEDRSYAFEALPQEIGSFGGGDYRTSSLRVQFPDGSETLRLKFQGYEITDGKYEIPGLPASYDDRNDAKTLTIRMKDEASGLEVELLYGVFYEADVITRSVRVLNRTNGPVFVKKVASTQLDFREAGFDLTTFSGRWARERSVDRTKLPHGTVSVGSRRGASSLQYNPSAILSEPNATEVTGRCYGFAFVYSGDFLLETETDPADETRFVLGIHPDLFSWKLEQGETFFSPEAVMTASTEGFSGVSRRFHDFVNRSVIRGYWRDRQKPVLLNNWEGTYFDFTGEKLIRMAKEASSLGVDLFVLDDGWFGKRDSDRSGLGDWYPNEEKLGMTIAELSERIRKEGVSFGIWFEPEAVSEDSDLYRAHPDWAIRVPGREPSLCRYELLLDLGREDVQEYLIERLTSVLRETKATYLKWDFNRTVTDRFSAVLPADRQGEFDHRYVLGVYRILAELCRTFPELLVEGCSSGGGRFDLGMLCYTPQIWTSDDTDPIERLSIQNGTSMIYPVRAMGAHVSASPNHQTGRRTPIRTRSVVAMSGTYGLELDPEKLTEEEIAEIRAEVSRFKALYDVIQWGDLYRLVPPTDQNATVWEQVSKDKQKAFVSVVYHALHAERTCTRFCVYGLDDNATYRVGLVRKEDMEKLTPAAKKLYRGSVFSGKTLRTAGLFAPYFERPEEYEAFQILIEAVGPEES